LADAFLLVRIALDLKSGNGETPPRLHGLQDDEGTLYDWNPDGTVTTSPKLVTDEVSSPGTLKINGHARSVKEAKQLTRRVLAKYNTSFEQAHVQVRNTEQPTPPLTTGVSIDDSFLRGISKMACNLFAARYAAVFLRLDFNPIRSFVLTGGDARSYVAFTVRPVNLNDHDARLGLLDHLVLVRGNTESGRVEALVTLYKHIQLVILLGTTNLTEDLAVSYRVDQLGKRHRRDDPHDLLLAIPSFARTQAHREEGHASMVAGFTTLTAFIDGWRAERLRRAQVIAETLEEVLGALPEDALITVEDWKRASRLIAERILAPHFGREPRTDP